MVSKLLRRSFTIDEEYMPIFVNAYKTMLAHAAYDYTSGMEAIVRTSQTVTVSRSMELLVERDTPFKAMRDAREQLRTRSPKDRRFSTNLHRRMLQLIDWEEREMISVLGLMTLDPTDITKAGLRQYGKASRVSDAISDRVNSYGNKINKELAFIYERFPELQPYLAEISESFGFPPHPTHAEPPSIHLEQSIMLALQAYERGLELQRLQEWLDRQLSLVRDTGAGLFNRYDARPVLVPEEINHDIGELWFQLHEFDRLAGRVPAAIAHGMPTNVKRDEVTKRWGVAVQDALNDFNTLVVSWEHIHAGAISPSSPAYRDTHFWTEFAALAMMADLHADISATLARWNGNEAAANAWGERGVAYASWGADLMNQLRNALRRLKTEQPAQYDALGFTDSVLMFLDLDDLIG